MPSYGGRHALTFYILAAAEIIISNALNIACKACHKISRFLAITTLNNNKMTSQIYKATTRRHSTSPYAEDREQDEGYDGDNGGKY